MNVLEKAKLITEMYKRTHVYHTESEIAKALIEAVEVIENLSRRHEWTPPAGKCKCKEHISARELLNSVKGD